MADQDLHSQRPAVYSPAEHQLVLEIYVSSLERSTSFYESLGFQVDWSVPDVFAQVSWDRSILFLKVKDTGATSSPAGGSGNVRIMVPDVDEKYEQCKKLGCIVEQEIGDRKFVLRDFIIKDPDGFGVRFGTFLPGRGRKEQVDGPVAEGVVRHGSRRV